MFKALFKPLKDKPLFKALEYIDFYYNLPDFITSDACEIELNGEYFRLYTYGDGFDEVPVFHVRNMNRYSDVAVCLFEPKFYQYNNVDIGTPFPFDLFDKALRETNKRVPKYTNWERLVDGWHSNHGFHKIDYMMVQPDYTKLGDNEIVKRDFVGMLISKLNA